MKCESPIQLKNGLVVPCGKCLLCLSAKRDDWSVRLQLHSVAYDSMPFFVTLTYRDEALKFGVDRATLCKSDLQLFIKRLKDRFDLYNTDFSYFGCGEYGSEEQFTHRPHYHLILFGFEALQKAYDKSWLDANKLILDSWQNGHVDVGVAKWSGIHYVTKYVLKYDTEKDYDGIEPPFIVYSQGLGLPWLNTRQGQFFRSKINVSKIRAAYRDMPDLDYSSIQTLRDSAAACLRYLSSAVPSLQVDLPSGNKAALPRFLKRKLFGSFEHFKDNPYWLVNSMMQLYNSCDYLLDRGQYDAESGISYAQQVVNFAKYRIEKRLILNNRI